MKHTPFFLVLLLALLLSACASANPAVAPAGGEKSGGLVVSGGDIKKTYSRADLEALPVTQSTFKDVNYKGVLVTDLLKDAGFDPQSVKALKAVASDGYAINYDAAQFLGEGVIVAYAQANGDLSADDGAFRMVLPNAEGKLNLRMLVELQVVQ